MKSFSILSVLTSAVVVKAASAATSTATANPLIPTGISTGCSAYMTALNTDSSLSSCTGPLITATSAFGPSGSGVAPTTAAVTSALGSLCGASANACSASIVRSALAKFYSACQEELTSDSNADVVRTYDVLYSLIPLQQAVCSKDDTGAYCATKSSKSSTAGSGTLVKTDSFDVSKYLVVNPAKRAESAAVYPNTTTYSSTNLPFLFLKAGMSSAALCTSCTRSVMTAYINFESNVPYAPGMSKSALLSGQSTLYNAINGTCGPTFMGGAVQAAGGIAGGVLSGGASPSSVASVGVAMLAAVAAVFATVV